MERGSGKAETEIELALRWQGGDAGLSCRSWSPDRRPTRSDARQGRFRRGPGVKTSLQQRREGPTLPGARALQGE